eukprot:scaffold5772_cov101-Cylindrotheca_fusiformis.AAC.5
MTFQSLKTKIQKKRSPDRLKPVASPVCSPTSSFSEVNEDALGYEAAVPDLAASSGRRGSVNSEASVSKYGYEAALPDSAASSGRRGSVNSTASISKYGYEDAAPSTPTENPSTPIASRRSSLKGSNGPRPHRRHSITFSNEVLVSPVVPTTAMIKNNSDLWFQEKDYDRMKQKVYAIADLAAEGEMDKKYCTRGLESLIKNNSSQKYGAWDAVLDEQENQLSSGDIDDQALSTVYRLYTASSQMEAKIRALKDEKAIKKYLFDTREICRRMSA